MYKSFLALGFCLFLTSCSLSSPTMTASAFDCIPIGAPVSQLEAQVGTPYEITSASQAGTQQYCYIERLEVGPGAVAQNTYFLTVKNGQVINKKCSNESKTLNVQYR